MVNIITFLQCEITPVDKVLVGWLVAYKLVPQNNLVISTTQ